VTFATGLVTVIRTPGLCQLSAKGGTVNILVAVQNGSRRLEGQHCESVASVAEPLWQRGVVEARVLL
jgi:hypothetical protein